MQCIFSYILRNSLFLFLFRNVYFSMSYVSVTFSDIKSTTVMKLEVRISNCDDGSYIYFILYFGVNFMEYRRSVCQFWLILTWQPGSVRLLYSSIISWMGLWCMIHRPRPYPYSQVGLTPYHTSFMIFLLDPIGLALLQIRQHSHNGK